MIQLRCLELYREIKAIEIIKDEKVVVCDMDNNYTIYNIYHVNYINRSILCDDFETYIKF